MNNEKFNIQDEITKWQKLLFETQNQIIQLTKKNNVTPNSNRIYLENDFIITKLNHFNFSYY